MNQNLNWMAYVFTVPIFWLLVYGAIVLITKKQNLLSFIVSLILSLPSIPLASYIIDQTVFIHGKLDASDAQEYMLSLGRQELSECIIQRIEDTKRDLSRDEIKIAHKHCEKEFQLGHLKQTIMK